VRLTDRNLIARGLPGTVTSGVTGGSTTGGSGLTGGSTGGSTTGGSGVTGGGGGANGEAHAVERADAPTEFIASIVTRTRAG
jgi:hypothetical protein